MITGKFASYPCHSLPDYFRLSMNCIVSFLTASCPSKQFSFRDSQNICFLKHLILRTNVNRWQLLLFSTVKPLNTADLGTGEKAAVFRKRRYWESYITYKTHIWDLKMGSGIGRAAVLGGAVLRGTTVHGVDCSEYVSWSRNIY